MKFLSNAEIYAAARAYSSNFEKSSSAYSAEEFYNYVAGMNSENARQLANEFTTTALMFYLNKVEGVAAKNPFENKDLIEKFFVPFAGLKQNMYVRVSKAVNPKFKGVTDGAGADPYRVKKPVVEDIYYTFNDDYQNYITISEIQMKTAFANENGVSSLISGIMMGLASQFTEWETDHLLETLSTLLNDNALRASQVEEITIADDDNITRDELKDFVACVNNVTDAMTIRATSAFNEANFPKVVDKSDLRLIVRPGLKNTLKTQLLESAFNKEELNMDIQEVVLPDFGGLIPSSDGTLANRLYMVYDEEGRPTDTYTTDADGLVPYTGDVEWYDPNADILGIVIEKGKLFEDDQNAYSVYGIYNPRNMCTTYWANKPTVGFHYDYFKNVVVIKKKISD